MELERFTKNNSFNCVLESVIPECTKSQKCMLGVDEAGRGPVLGPMVYGISFCPVSELKKLADLGFADSKTLSEEMREKLFGVIEENADFIGWKTEIMSPNFISNGMLQRGKYNLNAMSHDCAIRLIQKALDDGINVSEVYVDTVGDPKKYQDKLLSIFPSLKITVAKKADATYPIVSAASICAKVTRDRSLKKWEFREGDKFADINYGSGYPSDPTTKSFIAENIDQVFGYPQLVRFSWSTADTMLQKKASKIEWSDDEEDDKPPSVMNYFGKNKSKSALKNPAMSHTFFKERGLHHVSSVDL